MQIVAIEDETSEEFPRHADIEIQPKSQRKKPLVSVQLCWFFLASIFAMASGVMWMKA